MDNALHIRGTLEDFLEAHKDDVFRFWVYRRLYTPYEQQNAFEDESVFEDHTCEFGMIRECVKLNNGDYLLGIQLVDGDEEDYDVMDFIDYYKLSEIRIEKRIMKDHET